MVVSNKIKKNGQRIRAKIKSVNKNKYPRLTVFRSSWHIYVQLIDDQKGVTLASASTVQKDLKGSVKKTSNIEAAIEVGKKIAEKAKALGVAQAVFDKGSYKFHGKVKALADAANEAGLMC
jgi:large subunit ribosomal protein L18